MIYRVEFADQAKSDLFDIYEWIAADSPVNAAQWVSTLEDAVLTLDASPERCPVAPENVGVEETEIRHLIVGSYRAIFIVSKETVFVLHIRHGSRRSATLEEIAAALQQHMRSAGPGEV
jgi:plasmid stabilization system protein ParE